MTNCELDINGTATPKQEPMVLRIAATKFGFMANLPVGRYSVKYPAFC
jgi:hypothetical protein